MKNLILKKKFFYFFILIAICYISNAQQPTWENGIACIIYSHCTPCHNPNSIAPFSLMSYNDAYEHASAIQHVVTLGEMPPYPPDRSYQHYQNERYLSDSEKLAINQWVARGAPSGDLSKALEPPVYDYEREITNPDFTAVIPTFTIPELTEDMYRCFVVSVPFAKEKYLSAIEVIPGNRSIVHHVQIFQDTSDKPVKLDSADALPGYNLFGGIGSKSAQRVTGWTPSGGALFFPRDMGLKINAGSRIIIQIHYPLGTTGKTDSTRVNFKYLLSRDPIRTVSDDALLHAEKTLVNGPLSIPPNEVKTFYEKLKLPETKSMSLLGVAPHAHLICISMKSYAVKPDGDTVPLINIKKWDFHWQGGYLFKKMVTLPGGSTIYGEAVYDNTVNNPMNPNNPPKLVERGQLSTDEMMSFYFFNLKAKPRDEEMIFDTTTRLPMYNDCGFVVRRTVKDFSETITQNESINTDSDGKIVSIYPNPVHDKLYLTLKGKEAAKILLYNINGQLLHEAGAKQGKNQFNLQHLPNGFYIIKIMTSKSSTTLRFLKQ